MNDKEILKKAIQKAVDGGWKDTGIGERILITNEHINPEVVERLGRELIFNHDFAKALWGDDKPTATQSGSTITIGFKHGWKHHLRAMVVADDPIKYLGENL